MSRANFVDTVTRGLHRAASEPLRGWFVGRRDVIGAVIERAAVSMPLYAYGVPFRPVSPGISVPGEGFVETLPQDPDAKAPTRHGVAVYNRPLTESEVQQYQLEPRWDPADLARQVAVKFTRYKDAYVKMYREDLKYMVQAVGQQMETLGGYTSESRDQIAERVRVLLDPPVQYKAGDHKVKLTEYAAGEVEMRKGVTDDIDEPEVLAVFKAFDGHNVIVNASNVDAVAEGLTALANICDDIAEHGARDGVSKDELKANRHASNGLSKAAMAVHKAVLA